MIGVANDVEALVKSNLSNALIRADSDYIDEKHSPHIDVQYNLRR